MFYANFDPNNKDFQLPEKKDQNRKPPSSAKPPKVLKEAGNMAVQIDQQVANLVLQDLQVGPKDNNKFDAVEMLLNQHKIKEQSPIRQQSPKAQPLMREDLKQSITNRLAQLEKLCHSQKCELKEKYQQIAELKDKLAEQQRLVGKDKQPYVEEIERQKVENLELKKRINEMEQFLNKYGVKWVDRNAKDVEPKMKQMLDDVNQPKPVFNYHLPKEISIEVIQRRIQELNYVIEKEGANQIVKNVNGMHQFQKIEPLPIGFYKNGIAMKGFKFFAYGSKDAYQILADILEGYFPYQLKHQYPNGTLLKVIDKTEDLYSTEKESVVDGKKNDERQLKPLSKDEFLDQLPKHVLKNGKIIPVRAGIAKIFEGKPGEAKVGSELPGCRKDPVDGSWIVETEAQKLADQGQVQQETCLLKLRSETGKHTLICLMFASQTIKDMYKAVEHLREDKSKQVEIILNFPRTSFSPNDETTLEDAGLMPSAQLFFK